MQKPAVNNGIFILEQAIFFQVVGFIPVFLDTLALIVYTLFTLWKMGWPSFGIFWKDCLSLMNSEYNKKSRYHKNK